MNHLYYGDNLRVLRESIADASVDLIYLDPPFNSNASYNVLFKGPEGTDSQAQIEAFDDAWHWTQSAEDAFADVLRSGNTDAAEMLRAMRAFLGENDMMAYLAMMAVRLIELHRVLKPTGSLYLHCDPTASHYLKILLDAVFGARNFQNEVVWKRTSAHSNATKKYSWVHDIILVYAKSPEWTFNQLYAPYSTEYINEHFVHRDADGRLFRRSDLVNPSVRPNLRYSFQASNGIIYKPHKNGWKVSIEVMRKLDDENRLFFPKKADARLRKKIYLDESPGVPLSGLWDDLPPIHASAQERLGYPTQKPVALLERIIAASSNPGDVVLDPFCGCGTTVHAAEKLGRQWIGIDVTHLAIALIQRRLRDAFEGVQFQVHGVPTDLAGAQALAEQDKHQFELWAVSLIPNAQPWKGGKKGADQGRDGILYVEGPNRKTETCIIEVKGGAIGDAQIRSLIGAMERSKAQMGVFVTLREPTRPMIATAAAAGNWETDWGPVPRVQIVTIGQLLSSPVPPLRIPMARTDSFRKAAREKRDDQGALDL